MPETKQQYKVEGINLDHFPRKIILRHGIEGEREWWEWTSGVGKDRKAITIQRYNQAVAWIIFFQHGDIVRSVDLPVEQADRDRGVVAITFGTFNLSQAILALASLGIASQKDNEANREELEFDLEMDLPDEVTEDIEEQMVKAVQERFGADKSGDDIEDYEYIFKCRVTVKEEVSRAVN